MTDKERITKLEERLAAAEARIAQLERESFRHQPIGPTIFGPMPTVGDPIPPFTITCSHPLSGTTDAIWMVDPKSGQI